METYAPQFIGHTLKSMINEQGGYVGFLVLNEFIPFIRDFRVLFFFLGSQCAK